MMNTQWTAEILLGLLTLPVLSRHDGFLSHHDKEVWNKSLKGKKKDEWENQNHKEGEKNSKL